MFVLDTTTRSLEVLLDAAPAASQLPVVVTYADVAFGGAAPYLPASSTTLTNGVTAVTAVAAPAAGVQRQVEEMTVRNDDTAARVVTLRYNDAGTPRKIISATLQAGETLEYTHAAGLRTLDANGASKVNSVAYQIARGAGFVQVNSDGSITASAAGTGTTFAAGAVVVTGQVVVRQPGGAAGVNEAQVSHDGQNLLLANKASAGTGNIYLTPGSLAGLVADSAGGQYWALSQSTATFRTYSSAQYAWTSSGSAFGAVDTGVGRAAPGVVSPTNGAGGPGWVQNAAGCRRLAADATNATATPVNLADLAVTLLAGRKYTGRMVVRCSDSVAADGVRFDFNGGTATMTSFNAGVTGNVQGATAGVTVSAAPAAALTFTAMNGTTDHWVAIDVSLVCSAGGTFVPRFAQNAHSTGTATAGAGSRLDLWDSAN